MDELKSCPFCNGKVFLWQNEDTLMPKFGKVIECENCGIRFHIPYVTEDFQAIAVWNHRSGDGRFGVALASALLKGIKEYNSKEDSNNERFD